MSIGTILRELHKEESRLACHLLSLAERHRAEHEIHHVARDLAAWCDDHLIHIAEAAPRFGIDPTTFSPVVHEDDGSAPASGLDLLRDLRQVHVNAVEVSLYWEMIAQAAQAAKDTQLLKLAQRCHLDTLRQARWANAHIKQLSPQILLS